MSRIVVALGGNALGLEPETQLVAVAKAAQTIVDMVVAGHNLIITHGNGPQVGMIKLGLDSANKVNDKVPYVALKECGAMSQGYIGYHLQQAIQNELSKRGLKKSVVTIVTQVEVDCNDPAFSNPTKPVGNFYTQVEAEKMQARGFSMIEDAGRGYRQVVASPQPIKIVELDVIKQLSLNDCLVIAVGGGGVPVIKIASQYVGVDAVIDKDNSSAQLAMELGADQLVILTAVDKVAINYQKPDHLDLDLLDLADIEKYKQANQFAKGSMLPKIEACARFVASGNNKVAIITSLEAAAAALNGVNGTKIVAKK